jgi:hypothetical protein
VGIGSGSVQPQGSAHLNVNFNSMDSEAKQIIDLYERHAHAYVIDRGRQSLNEGIWLDRFTALLPEGGSIIGCGCGEPIARYLIEQRFAVERSGRLADDDFALPRAFPTSVLARG